MNELERTTDAVLKTAEGISNYGAMTVLTAVVIVLFIVMMLYFFFSHKRMAKEMAEQSKLYSKTITDSNKEAALSNKAIAETLKKLDAYLLPMSENARLSTLTAIYMIAENNFKLSMETVLNAIERIQKENNIVNKEATRLKLRKFLTNVNNERMLYFKNFSYQGKTMDKYVFPKWIGQIEDIAFEEIYDKNESRARTNIKQAYESILIEFKQNILRG